MIRHAILAASLLLMAAGPPPPSSPPPAPAEKPVMQPTRDAVVGYHLAPASGEAIDVRVMLRAGGQLLRMDLPDYSIILVQPATRQLTLVVPTERTALELPWSDGPQPLFLVDDSKRYTRKGEATIAGQRCTMWDAVADRARSSVCVTADGIILRQLTFDAVGRRSLVEAVVIRYEPLGAADFEVPPGFQRMVGTAQ